MRHLLILFACLFCTTFAHADHSSTKNGGTVTLANGEVWHVKEIDCLNQGLKQHFSIASPAEMKTMLDGGFWCLYCFYGDQYYECAFVPGAAYKPPKTYAEFEKFVLSKFKSDQVAGFRQVKTKGKDVIFRTDLDIMFGGSVVDAKFAIIATKNSLITLRIEGYDFSKVDDFFDSFKVLP